MLAKTILAIAGLAASVSAIMVNSPAKGAKIDLSEKNTITWSSVSTDPSTFTLALVDQSTMGSIVIDAKVTTSDDKFDLTNVVAPPGAKYKFNFLSNDPLNNGILAQSETFEIVKSEKSSSSSSAVATTTTSGSSTATGSADESSTTGESSTTFKTASPTKTSGTSPAGETANASSTPSGAAATKTPNAAASLDKSFALGGGVLAALLMLF